MNRRRTLDRLARRLVAADGGAGGGPGAPASGRAASVEAQFSRRSRSISTCDTLVNPELPPESTRRGHPPPQRLRRGADLGSHRRDRRPLRPMLRRRLRNQPHRPRPLLGGNLHPSYSIPSRVRSPTKARTVHCIHLVGCRDSILPLDASTTGCRRAGCRVVLARPRRPTRGATRPTPGTFPVGSNRERTAAHPDRHRLQPDSHNRSPIVVAPDQIHVVSGHCSRADGVTDRSPSQSMLTPLSVPRSTTNPLVRAC
jgi:hypothetical protein